MTSRKIDVNATADFQHFHAGIGHQDSLLAIGVGAKIARQFGHLREVDRRGATVQIHVPIGELGQLAEIRRKC